MITIPVLGLAEKDYFRDGSPHEKHFPHYLIQTGLVALARGGPGHSCTPACFHFQTGSVWPKPDSQPFLYQIRSGSTQYDLGHLWKNTTKSEGGKLAAVF